MNHKRIYVGVFAQDEDDFRAYSKKKFKFKDGDYLGLVKRFEKPGLTVSYLDCKVAGLECDYVEFTAKCCKEHRQVKHCRNCLRYKTMCEGE